jgi:hypothetical protein
MKRLSVLLFVIVFILTVFPIGITVHAATPITFSGEELVGKPTNNSITINIVPNTTIEYHYQYGTSPGSYTMQTADSTATGGQPHEIVISGLTPNTHYYYRMRYHLPGETDWVERAEHSFWTQRAAGSTFKFTIVADSHAYYNTEYHNTMSSVASDQPDFHFDLGDTFMTDNDTNQSQVNAEYLAQRGGDYMDLVGHSSPIFNMPGNHENEEGWNFDDTPFSIALASVKARKLYYPTPIPGEGFYAGNSDLLTALDPGTYGDQYREDYYAWTWGDALFVVIDPYHYTMTNPYGASAGEGSDDPASGDAWNWTLGLQQYNWLKNVLESSDAKYKFVFSHHVVGGMPSYLYVRGGAQAVPYYEWGGNTWGGTPQFSTKRSGWDAPIHQLFMENDVSAFFHGHDHQYAYEVRDEIVYQCLPRPTTGMDFNYYHESDPYTIKVLSSPGYLRVTVSPTQATVEYIGPSGGTSKYTYTIQPSSTTNNPPDAVNDTATVIKDSVNNVIDVLANDSCLPDVGETLSVTGVTDPPHGTATNNVTNVTYTPDTGYSGPDSFSYTIDDGNGGTDSATVSVTVTEGGSILGDVNGDGYANSTDALIILSCDVGLNTASFCPMNCGDVNSDGLVNSTDALIILSYDVGITVPYPVGEPGCPSSVTPCPGCSG